MSDDALRKPPTLQERARDAVRADIAEQALRLFDDHGFDQTTVDEIVAVVGISPRSFFRYFASKEDVVLGDLPTSGLIVRDTLASRPPQEAPWEALRASLQPVVDLTQADLAGAVRVMRIVTGAASLRARNLEKHLEWVRMLAPLISKRLDTADQDRELVATALATASLACLDVALAELVDTDGSRSLDELLDVAIAAVRH